MRRWWHLFKETVLEGRRDNLNLFASGFSYFILFSIIPLSLFAIAVAGKLVSSHFSHGFLLEQLEGMFGADAARSFETFFIGVNKSQLAKGGVIGGLIVFYGASRIFIILQRAISQIWDKEEKRRGGLKGAVAVRLRSVVLMIIPVVVVLGCFIATGMISAMRHKLHQYGLETGFQFALHLLSQAFSLCLYAFVFASINKFLPLKKPSWKNVLFGALVTTVVFALARYIFTSVFRLSHVSAMFGPVGSIILILMWIYLSMLIFLYGSEFTRIYSNKKDLRSALPSGTS